MPDATAKITCRRNVLSSKSQSIIAYVLNVNKTIFADGGPSEIWWFHFFEFFENNTHDRSSEIRVTLALRPKEIEQDKEMRLG